MRQQTYQIFVLICLNIALLLAPNHIYAQSHRPEPSDLENPLALRVNWGIHVAFPNNQLNVIWWGHVAHYDGEEIAAILDSIKIDITAKCTPNQPLVIENEIAYFNGHYIGCDLPDYLPILNGLLSKYDRSYLTGESQCTCRFTGEPWVAVDALVSNVNGSHPLISVTGRSENGRVVFADFVVAKFWAYKVFLLNCSQF